MNRNPQIIANEILSLVSELAALAGVSLSDNLTDIKTKPSLEKKAKSGATGGIRLLIEDGKFDSPKQLPEIMGFLKQEGRHYSNGTVAMGLLRLVKERVLTRFKDKDEKNWKYAVRR